MCACAANNVMGKGMQSSGLAPGCVMNCPEVLGEVLRLNDQEARCGSVVLAAGKKATEMQSADEIFLGGIFQRLYTTVQNAGNI